MGLAEGERLFDGTNAGAADFGQRRAQFGVVGGVEIDVDAQPRPAKGDGFRQTGRDAAGQVALAGGRRAHPQQRRHG